MSELCLPFWERCCFYFLHDGEEEGGEIGEDERLHHHHHGHHHHHHHHHHGHRLHVIVLEVDPRGQYMGVLHFIDIAALC